MIHNIEINPGQGAKLVRAAGQEAQLMAKEGKFANLRLPSGEMRLIMFNCRATIGTVGNAEYENIKLGKAGKTRHLGKRPEVRGSAMNPVDHPHGGGEGKAPVGHAGPMTPWGKPALGYKTRKNGIEVDKFIAFWNFFLEFFFALTTSCRFARAYRSRTNLITKHSSLDLFYQ